MKFINNTPRRLKFYFGDIHKEEPEAEVILKAGGAIDLDCDPEIDFIIQED